MKGRSRRQQLTKSGHRSVRRLTIHSAIHEVREDAGCVLHLHTLDGTASRAAAKPAAVQPDAQFVTTNLAYHDYEAWRST